MKPDTVSRRPRGPWLVVGAGVGAAIGSASGAIATWLALGVALGLLLDLASVRGRRPSRKPRP